MISGIEDPQLQSYASSLIETFLKASVDELGKTFVRKIVTRIWKKKEQVDILKIGAQKYASKIIEVHSSIKVLGMTEPMSLKDLYVRVYFLSLLTD